MLYVVCGVWCVCCGVCVVCLLYCVYCDVVACELTPSPPPARMAACIVAAGRENDAAVAVQGGLVKSLKGMLCYVMLCYVMLCYVCILSLCMYPCVVKRDTCALQYARANDYCAPLLPTLTARTGRRLGHASGQLCGRKARCARWVRRAPAFLIFWGTNTPFYIKTKKQTKTNNKNSFRICIGKVSLFGSLR
jgi:hypothetical protein